MDGYYMGPWLRFSRGTKSGAPLIRYTTDGKVWRTMNEEESWDIIVMLRGPDTGEDFNTPIKDSITARIRGMLLNWEGVLRSEQTMGKVVGKSGRAYAYRPRGEIPERLSTRSPVGEHFTGHWYMARSVLIKYFGGNWPMGPGL